MRERRAQRLLLRAEIAAEAGCPEDAKACLEEARSLVPALQGADAVEAALARAAAAEERPAPLELPLFAATETESVEGGHSRKALYTAAAVAAMLLLAVPLIWSRHTEVGSAQPTSAAPVEAAAPATTLPVQAIPAPAPQPAAQPQTIATTGVAEPAPRHDDPAPRVDETTARVEKASTPVIPRVPAPQPAPRDAAPLSAPPPPVTPALDVRANVSDTVSALPPTVPVSAPPGPPPAPAPALTSVETTLPPASTPAPTPVAPSQEPMVRSVLNRYASAYSALDVDAAARVWPGLNRAALSRAFDSLSTQRVSLGDCRIDVNGATAQARCAGTATWSPKVGSGSRTEARQWTFQLTRGGGDWQIVSARVQNR